VPSSSNRRWPLVFESLAVGLSPVIAFFVLRLRAMAPVELPDPSMHTIYVVDPAQMFNRYAAAFAATARMREGAQAGFLVLARLAYLGFGILPGFFVTRYVFALIAVVPAYVLMRRLYGIWAGAVVTIVILSCPVIITAWGTDYPDCAVVSYVAGAVACLAMGSSGRFRRGFIVAGGALLTLGVFSHGMGVVLAVTTLLVYGLVGLVRQPRRLVADIGVLGLTGVVTTGLLMVASRLVLGQFNFIAPTIAGAEYLNRPDQIIQWHSSNWRWAPYVAYLLVPPSVIVSFLVVFSRRLASIPTPVMFVGLVCTAQVAVFSYLQFGYHVQTLEMHFFSSTMWGSVAIALGVVLAEMAKPLSAHRLWRYVPALCVLAVPLCYEADANVPAFGWVPYGFVLAGVPVLLAVIVRLWARPRATHSALRATVVLTVAVSLIATSGALLELTVAPRPQTPPLKAIALAGDPSSGYNTALGGDASALIDWYQVSACLPGFVGNPSYNGEQLLMWFFYDVPDLLEPVGIFHEGYDSLGFGLPILTPSDEHELATRRPAELLLLGLTTRGFKSALRDLGPYQPVLVRATVLKHGTAVLHASLIVLRAFARRSIWPAGAS
jgi:hypothetical protein